MTATTQLHRRLSSFGVLLLTLSCLSPVVSVYGAGSLSLAHEKGPHFADALKAWGDVLVNQNHPKEALAKYDEALRDAPDWAELQQARAAAARRN